MCHLHHQKYCQLERAPPGQDEPPLLSKDQKIRLQEKNLTFKRKWKIRRDYLSCLSTHVSGHMKILVKPFHAKRATRQ